MKNSLYKPISLLYISLLLVICGCGRRQVEGIYIGDTLYEHQNLTGNREFCILIEHNLKGDPDALRELSEFDCGDGAGCYDLGSVITQIIYRRGEKDFAETVQQAGPENLPRLKSLVRAGLEYGDQDGDGKADERSIEETFPLLNEMLAD